MIRTLYGRIFETDFTGGTVVIECQGVGYQVSVTANTLSHLPAPRFQPSGPTQTPTNGLTQAPEGEAKNGAPLAGEMVRLYTHMAVREDSVDLFGFYTKEELAMFRLLIGVSGIGPKGAMAILSLLTPKKLFAAIVTGDTKAISRAPGVGAKTAARVVLELKDKAAKEFPEYAAFFTEGGTVEEAGDAVVKRAVGQNAKLADAREALEVLGYSRSEIAASMKNVNPESSLEDIIRDALQALMK